MKSEKQKDRKRMMLEDPIPGLVTSMALPAIIAFLINSIYSLADTYFVSSLGTNATAAVSVNASLDQIIMMAGSLMAVGANSYISRLLGAKQDEEAKRVLTTSLYLTAGFGTVLLVLGVLFTDPLVMLLGATPTCEQYAIDYATYVLLVAPFMASNFVLNQCLRAEGSAVLSMIGMGFGGILNCVLDPFFIFYLGLGVKGASMATAISKLVSFAILIFPYLSHRSLLSIAPRYFKLEPGMLAEVVSVGSSSMFRSGLAVLSAVILNNLAGDISDSVLAGIGVCNKVMMFPFGIILGFGTGFQPVIGFSWGAKNYHRAWESYRFASRVAIIGSTVMGVLLALFANEGIRLFSDTDPVMQQIGALSICLQCLALPVHGWVMIVNSMCSALGKAKQAVLLSTSRQGSCFLPIVYPMYLLLGKIGVASTQAVADVLSLALAFPIMRGVTAEIRRLAAENGQTLEEQPPAM